MSIEFLASHESLHKVVRGRMCASKVIYSAAWPLYLVIPASNFWSIQLEKVAQSDSVRFVAVPLAPEREALPSWPGSGGASNPIK
jgi:hypothetical protein